MKCPVIGGVPIFIDPELAIGYEYAIGAGDPLFASVRLPIGIGDKFYTLLVGGDSFSLAAGVLFDFRTHGFLSGVSAFSVTGIEVNAAIDPANPLAFPTELTFMGNGLFTGTKTPITISVPEPGTLVLIFGALLGLAVRRRDS